VSLHNSHVVTSTNKTKCKIYKKTGLLKDMFITSENSYFNKVIFIAYVIY